MKLEFRAKLWLYPGDAGWHFVTLPPAAAAQVKFFAGQARGFGSVRVKAKVGVSTWKTSLFPDKTEASFLLPVKADVRSAEKLAAGSEVQVRLELDI